MEAAATEDETSVQANPSPEGTKRTDTRPRPVRGSFRAHLQRERVVVPTSTACAAAGASCPSWVRRSPRRWR